MDIKSIPVFLDDEGWLILNPGDRIYCPICERHATVVTLEEWNSSNRGVVTPGELHRYVLFKTDRSWGNRTLWRSLKTQVKLIKRADNKEANGQLLMF